jgi:hypothetical protein
MIPEIIPAISAIVGAAIGGGSAIIAANITLEKQLEAQDKRIRQESFKKALSVLSRLSREGSLIQSTATTRKESPVEYDEEWLSTTNEAQLDEFLAIVDIYMPNQSETSKELYTELTKFWYEHSMMLSIKQNESDIPESFYDKVVPISIKIENLCKTIRNEVRNNL